MFIVLVGVRFSNWLPLLASGLLFLQYCRPYASDTARLAIQVFERPSKIDSPEHENILEHTRIRLHMDSVHSMFHLFLNINA